MLERAVYAEKDDMGLLCILEDVVKELKIKKDLSEALTGANTRLLSAITKIQSQNQPLSDSKLPPRYNRKISLDETGLQPRHNKKRFHGSQPNILRYAEQQDLQLPSLSELERLKHDINQLMINRRRSSSDPPKPPI
ncbi:hypothetical protein AKO1_011682 [Acrasis kona]|uniref:Uncharacterized protein n=1 Tax=Acrasis kona TaxID=1008807 RepID=A0AAW2Z8Q9_9EUKA